MGWASCKSRISGRVCTCFSPRTHSADRPVAKFYRHGRSVFHVFLEATIDFKSCFVLVTRHKFSINTNSDHNTAFVFLN